MKSVNRNFLEPSGTLQACNETALPYSQRVTELIKEKRGPLSALITNRIL